MEMTKAAASEVIQATMKAKEERGIVRRFLEYNEKQMDAMDIDRDGKISKEEWFAGYGSEKGFDSADLNGDGVIDADEYLREEMRVKHRRKRHTELNRR